MTDTFVACAVEDCAGNAHTDAGGARGWCRKHYRRWYEYGQPDAGETYKGDVQAFFHEKVLPYRGKDCLIWPFSRTGAGYGKLRYGDRTVSASRLACELVNGSPPHPSYQAAHSCGRGKQGCVAPSHLSWKRRRDNEFDKIAHGTAPRGSRHGRSKLTDHQVREIRAMAADVPTEAIARKFSIGLSQTRDIIARRAWKDLRDE